MKTKTDLYTKIVLTVIAVFLGVIVFKDINLVTKAQANELDLSALKIENASDEEGTTFFIYENSKLKEPFRTDDYPWKAYECQINYNDIPTHIITTLKTRKNSHIKVTRAK